MQKSCSPDVSGLSFSKFPCAEMHAFAKICSRAGQAELSRPPLLVGVTMPSDRESDAMRQQIAELLEESQRIRERSEDLARRIADLRARVERDEAEHRRSDDSPTS